MLFALVADDLHIAHDHSVHLFEESNIAIDSELEIDSELKIDSEELNQIKKKMQNTIASLASSIENQKYNALHSSDNNEIERIFAQIDLAQARITKDQEEIESLARETDELLNQLEDKAS